MTNRSRQPLLDANRSMLEGDRDGSLRHLEDSGEGHEALWLRAHAVRSEEERQELLERIAGDRRSPYADLASRIIAREEYYAAQLAAPPEYQFWKLPTWKARWKRIREYRSWLIAGIVLFLLIIVIIVAALQGRASSAGEALAVQMTRTAAAVAGQTSITYPAGRLTALRVENPTQRPVTLGAYYGDDIMLATPATGAQFAAIQVEFICTLAVCDAPPQASVSLRLSNLQTVGYDGSFQPMLVEQTSYPRIANGQSARLWLVFEVPAGAQPKSLVVLSGDQDPVQEISLTSFQ